MEKKFRTLITLALLFFFGACIKNSNELKKEENSRTVKRSVTENMAYPDTYPEWGSIGENRPKTSVNESYSPYPMTILRLEFSNPSNNDPNGIPSQYFHLQWRKLNLGYGVESKWYNYHPTKINYDTLRIDTLTDNFHPSLGQWFFDVNPKLFPAGVIQVRARLLYPPLDTSQKSCATLWSTYYGIVFNTFGDVNWNPGGSHTQDSVSFTAEIFTNVELIRDPGYTGVSHMEIITGGQSHISYSPSSGGLTHYKHINTFYETPTNFSNTVVVKLYNGSNVVSTHSKTFSHYAYITKLMGSEPLLNFSENFTIDLR